MHQSPLDATCSRHLRFRDLVECGETWQRLAGAVDNVPRQTGTWDGLRRVATEVLDPVIERFGPIRLTYGFAGPALTRQIAGRIAPSLDQHAGSELNARGRPTCPRLGQAVDLHVAGLGSRELAQWLIANTPFDRLYFYGDERPVHVSVGPDESRAVVTMLQGPSGRRIPKVVAGL
ncbi:MAG: hypothetical protein IV100_15985 [Myxococcales bacterium]|nr:hypothetical protein [Myxococcales bacterium]